MPTENRSSNTNMASAKVCGYTPGQARIELRLDPSGPLPAWLELGEAVIVKPAEQHQGEPYGWVQTRGDAINQFTQEWDVVQEWQAQGFKFKAMHDDLGEIERLRAEAKRLELMVAQADFNYDSDRHQFQRDLADRNALLRSALQDCIDIELMRMMRGSIYTNRLSDRIKAALAASAETSKTGNPELSGAEPVAPSWACQQCKLEQPTARPCDVCGGPVERDESGEMKDALRAFVGAAYPVALQINKRGHNWSEAYLDEALVLARAALERKPA